jgi:peroxiredoxin
LYIQARCPHCSGAAHFADSLRRARGVPLVVVSSDTPSLAAGFAQRAGLAEPVVYDSARAIARALNIRLVPTLITIDAQRRARRVVGAQSRAEMRRALARVTPK